MDKELLQRAANEIKQLRSLNEIMSARLEMFDRMMMLFTAQPNNTHQGYAQDIVYEIDKTIAEIELNESRKFEQVDTSTNAYMGGKP